MCLAPLQRREDHRFEMTTQLVTVDRFHVVSLDSLGIDANPELPFFHGGQHNEPCPSANLAWGPKRLPAGMSMNCSLNSDGGELCDASQPAWNTTYSSAARRN